MKRIVSSILFLGAFLIVANFGSGEEGSVTGRTKPAVSFKGTLETWQTSDKYPVENITIGRQYKQIQVWAMPSAEHLNAEESLITCPKKIQYKLDLAEIKEISCPAKPSWKYKKNKRELKSETEKDKDANGCKEEEKFIEIIVISNKSPEPKTYLISATKELILDDMSQGVPKEMNVELKAVKKLTISGYSKRDETKKCE